MFSGIFKSVVIAALLGAIGCSNQVPNGASAKVNDSIESETPLPSTAKSLITIEGGKAIETILSNRQSSETEVRFAVTTDVEIEGQTEFVVAMYVRDLGDDRALAGYRLEDASGKTLWTSEYAANIADMSWIEMSRRNSEHSWSLVVETKGGFSRQTHTLDNVRIVGESSITGTDGEKFGGSNVETGRRLNSMYSNNRSFFEKQPDQFVVSILTNESLLPWVAGSIYEKSGLDEPQFVGGWGKLICDVLKSISASVCDPESSLHDETACVALGAAVAICELLRILRVI